MNSFSELMHYVSVCEHGVTCTVCCWPWTGGTSKGGYGKARYGQLQTHTHRLIYMHLYKGVLTRSTLVLHRCDNPPCCNWHHLFLGTDKTNAEDRVAKGRNGRRAVGMQAKLTAAQVYQIRRLYGSGGWGYGSLSHVFPVSEAIIEKIIKRQDWRHLIGEYRPLYRWCGGWGGG